MAYTKDKAIELARSFLQQASKRHPIRLAYLFGSYAKGNSGEYSDIDIAVVLGKIEQDRYCEETFEIFHEAQEYNSLLEILCFKEDEFEKHSEAIVSRIKKEGIKIEDDGRLIDCQKGAYLECGM